MPKSHDSRDKLKEDDLYDGPPYSSRENGQKISLLRFECFETFKEKAPKFLKITKWSFMTFVWDLNNPLFH